MNKNLEMTLLPRGFGMYEGLKKAGYSEEKIREYLSNRYGALYFPPTKNIDWCNVSRDYAASVSYADMVSLSIAEESDYHNDIKDEWLLYCSEI